MLSFFLPFLTISTWSWCIFHCPPSSSPPPVLQPVVNLNWTLVPSYIASFMEHNIPDQLIGSVAALNYTHINNHIVQDYFKDQLQEMENIILYIHWDDLPKDTLEWIKEHPKEAAFVALDIGIFIAPWLVSEPLLVGLGFGRLGPVAESAASIAQRAIGKLTARSFFSHLQSAGMKGYGKPVLDRIVRGGATLVGAGWKWIWGKKDDQPQTSSVANVVGKAVYAEGQGRVDLKRYY